jgi:hypothetical protein
MIPTTDIDSSPLRYEARVAGFCYLLVISGGIFSALFAREALFAPGDAASTARAIAENETLWRWGMAVHLLYLIPGALMNVILYRLLKPVHATLALLALVLAMCDIAMEALLLTSLYVPLAMIEEGGPLSALPEAQRQALGHLAVRLFLTGWSFALLLFSGFCAVTGLLILRSRLIPRLIGGLMIAAGASYFVNSLAGMVSPMLAAMLLPWILLPSFVGEFSLGMWLLVKGVRMTDSSH